MNNNDVFLIKSISEAKNALSIANLIFHPHAIDRINAMADEISKSTSLLPLCFQGDKEAVKALIITAGSLCMDPFAIGKHAYKAPNGTIAFEAKVYQAIAEVAVGIKFSVKYHGNWQKIIGKHREQKNSSGKSYRVATWTEQDEKDLAIELTGIWQDGTEQTLDLYMLECQPRFSTLWATNPRQQLYYAAVKIFLRRYAPAAIMGIFDTDDERVNEKVINHEIEQKSVKIIESIDGIITNDEIVSDDNELYLDENLSANDVLSM